MAGSKWVYHKYFCETCDDFQEEMVDRHEVPETIECPVCGDNAALAPSGGILRLEIEEKTHGGRMTNGKLYRQHTGFKEVAAQRAEENRLKKARREGNKEEMADAKKALKRLQDETKRSITK